MSPRKLVYKVYDEPVEFEMVEDTFERSTGARRRRAAIDINRFGRSVTNVEGAETFMAFFMDQGVNPMQPYFTYGVNRAKGVIALYASMMDGAGAMALTWNKDRRTYSFHMGAVFEKHPSLRPVTRVEPQFEATLDSKGQPCLSVKIKGAPAKRHGPTESDETTQATDKSDKKPRKSRKKKDS